MTDVRLDAAGPMGHAADAALTAEPVAIVGLGCRFPGANGPAAFWSLLMERRDAITEVPRDRFDVDALFDPKPGSPGRVMSRYGGFLDGIDRFDASFFGISPREAERLDPQQRLLLEVGWQALDDAGYAGEREMAPRAGVFVGIWLNDYESRLFRDPSAIDFHMTTGSGRYAGAGRLSYALGLGGPSLTIDTACSSSLVAVHLACQSVRSGESSIALAGGVNVILEPSITIAYSQSGMMAADGRCKFGDARADGYVRSDGVGLVVLKRLSSAMADGDRIYAVIRGSAVNNDGRSSGFLATPGRAGQEAMLRRAYESAGIPPGRVQYVEAHGTGTRAGDPVEIGALGAVLAEGRAPGATCRVGSVKTNIGHTEGAAGVAGLIKVALSLHHGVIPASLHCETPTPAIPWTELPLTLQREASAWPMPAERPVAGVSAFGIAGTNAHVVLEQHRSARAADAPARDAGVFVLPVSAESPESLTDLAAAYAALLRHDPAMPLEDVCYTAAVRRRHLRYRAVHVGADRDALVASLAAQAETLPASPIAEGRRPIVFVFPGQGAQWRGMGLELLASEPVFREAFDRCEAAIQAEAGWSARDVLESGDGDGRFDRIDVAQPLLFAISVALAALWRSWGLVPDAVVGHSMGEVAAAVVAGALTLEDGVTVICRRSGLLRRTSGQGAMVLVELSADEATAVLDGYRDRVSIAVVNARRSTVISGDPAALDEIVDRLERREVFCRRIKVDVASHSPQMDPLRGDLERALADIRPRRATVPVYSTVTGVPLDGSGLDAAYWRDNLREPVRFADAIEQLLHDGHLTFIEMSPHPLLVGAVQEAAVTVPHVIAVGSLRREESEHGALFEALGHVHASGHAIAWRALYPQARPVVSLPEYPWRRERFWYDAAPAGSSRNAWPSPEDSDWTLHGERTAFVRWRPLPESAATSLTIDGASVVPISVLLDLVLETWRRSAGTAPQALTSVRVLRPIVVPPDAELSLHVAFGARIESGTPFRIAERAVGEPRDVLTGVIDVVASRDPGVPAVQEPIDGEAVEAEAFYLSARSHGVEIGPALQIVGKGLRSRTVIRAGLGRMAGLRGRAQRVMRLEAALQAAASLARASGASGRSAALPRSIGEVRFDAALADGDLQVIACANDDYARADVIAGPEGAPVLSVRGARFDWGSDAALDVSRWLYEPVWRRVPRPLDAQPRNRQGETWLVVADASGAGHALARHLHADGARTSLVASLGDLDDGLSRMGTSLTGVVFCGAIDARDPDALSVTAIAGEGTRVAAALVAAIQALAGRSWTHPPCLWVVTRGAQAIGAGRVDPLQTMLWGLGQVAAEEHPDVWGGLIDLDPAEDAAASAGCIADEIDAEPAERHVAFRGGARHVWRLARPADAPGAPIPWRPDATYLVTSGLTGLGAEVAQWMVRCGARRLIVMGRTLLPERSAWPATREPAVSARIDVVRALEALGASVHVAPVDLADHEAVRRWVEQFRREGWPPIRGIFHAAAIAEDGLIERIDLASIARVLQPKAIGAVVLDRVFAGEPLDFFVLCSSIGSVLGLPGQAAYALANAFVDGVAHARAARGLRAQAVSWGMWTGLGLAASAGAAVTKAHLAGGGIDAFTTEDGLDALRLVMARRSPHLAVIPVDGRRLRRSHWVANDPAFFSELTIDTAPADDTVTADVRAALAAAPRDEQQARLEAWLRMQLSNVLKLRADRIDRDRPLGTLGLESLMAVELRNRFEAALGIRLSATVVWSHPTIRALATYLGGRLDLPFARPAADAGADRRGDTRADLDLVELSDEEALRALTERRP